MEPAERSWVYILWSDTAQRYYVGQTTDVARRLAMHNNGRETWTKRGVPWRLVQAAWWPIRRAPAQGLPQLRLHSRVVLSASQMTANEREAQLEIDLVAEGMHGLFAAVP